MAGRGDRAAVAGLRCGVIRFHVLVLPAVGRVDFIRKPVACAFPRSGDDREGRGGAGDQGVEVVAGECQLRVRGLGAVDHGAERAVFPATLRVPAQVLARDAQAGWFAVEIVQPARVAGQASSGARTSELPYLMRKAYSVR